MVFDRRPDEVFMEVTQRALEVFKSGVSTVSTTIRSGDQMLGEMNDALVGGRPKFGETPTETFEAVYNMLTATLEDAREKKSAAAPSVVQKSREILAKVNAAEPAWRSGPVRTGRLTGRPCRDPRSARSGQPQARQGRAHR